jgi:hypothetical protein
MHQARRGAIVPFDGSQLTGRAEGWSEDASITRAECVKLTRVPASSQTSPGPASASDRDRNDPGAIGLHVPGHKGLRPVAAPGFRLHKERRSPALRSVTIAGLMLLLFAVGGNLVLSLLHVSLPAFRVAGGMLLFLQALTLTFSSPGLSSINDGERRDAEKPGDIAVFPLAFPLIASPGALSAVVLLCRMTGIYIFRRLFIPLRRPFLRVALSRHSTRSQFFTLDVIFRKVGFSAVNGFCRHVVFLVASAKNT